MKTHLYPPIATHKPNAPRRTACGRRVPPVNDPVGTGEVSYLGVVGTITLPIPLAGHEWKHEISYHRPRVGEPTCRACRKAGGLEP